MLRPRTQRGDLLSVLREIALALGVAASVPFLLFVLYASSELWPELPLSSAVGLPLLIALALAPVGVLIALHWELAGGAITVVCAIAITTLVNLGSRHGLLLLALLNSLPYALIGLLLLLGNQQTRRRRLWQVVAISALVYIGSGRALLLLATLNSVPMFVAGILFLACHRRTGQPPLMATAKDATASHGSKLTPVQNAS
jgi:hypothetical protein